VKVLILAALLAAALAPVAAHADKALDDFLESKMAPKLYDPCGTGAGHDDKACADKQAEQAKEKADADAFAAAYAKLEREEALAACNDKPTSLGVLLCRGAFIEPKLSVKARKRERVRYDGMLPGDDVTV
jgi:hypothetical protein